MGSEVVVLNGSGQYWGDRTLHDVIRLHANDKITTLMADESRVIRAGTNSSGSVSCMEYPLIVMLKTFFGCSCPVIELEYSEDLVYERDGNRCQYWHHDHFGRRFVYTCTKEDRTIDHIIPKCRGGEKKSFLNCVCACQECNIKRKGRLTPKEAGLQLIRTPYDPQKRIGGWARVAFNFNPEVTAHVAYKRYLESLVA